MINNPEHIQGPQKQESKHFPTFFSSSRKKLEIIQLLIMYWEESWLPSASDGWEQDSWQLGRDCLTAWKDSWQEETPADLKWTGVLGCTEVTSKQKKTAKRVCRNWGQRSPGWSSQYYVGLLKELCRIKQYYQKPNILSVKKCVFSWKRLL